MSRRRRSLLDRRRPSAVSVDDDLGGAEEEAAEREGTGPSPQPSTDAAALDAPPAPSGFRRPETPPPHAADRPEQLGPWRVLEVVGAVQRRRLLRVRHKDSDRIQALLDAPADAAPEHAHALVRQAELLFGLKHPSLATVRNVVLDQQPPWLEFDDVDGRPLIDVIDAGELYLAQSLDIAEQLLGALVHLHARDIVHGDLHPAHVLLTRSGAIKLCGFGRATGPSASPPSAGPHTAPGYTPPEWPNQAHDPRIDLHGVGCMLYHMLRGHGPFRAPARGAPLSHAIGIHRLRQQPHLDPGSAFHDDLRHLVRQLTQRDPSQRIPSAAKALGALQRLDRSYATSA